MQESLEEKSYLFQMLLDNVPVVIFKTNKDGVFTRSVGLGLKVFGVKDNESVGKSIFELYPIAGEIMRRALAGESLKFVADVEIQGKMIFLDVTLCPDPSDVGGVIGFFWILPDKIMSRKNRERQVRFLAQKTRS
ncbi:PAS domain-containing protein [Pedobacter steynii]